MAAEESYKLVAALAIHRLFIRELLVLAFEQRPNAIDDFDGFAARITSKLDLATVPPLDPALSDLLAQEFAEAARSILEESRSTLASLLSQLPPQAGPHS